MRMRQITQGSEPRTYATITMKRGQCTQVATDFSRHTGRFRERLDGCGKGGAVAHRPDEE
ncbi:hypothetical protein F2B00_16620 [Streptomyces parvus]|uniref:Uncharacterized protein n=1 Tax=Streptomyces parvus TaxID=66428 RepID=A0A5D4IXJ6_9ACTN|nr:hypothetical protein F2B00_16620 [Streptomyces parvus]PVC82563.1 hypothetical protein DBP20_19265 [Streptomyces sp. CS131]TYR57004.1 hypothetical protein FY004_22965 [Streptomyces parvus]